MINYVSRRICIRYKTPFHPDLGNELLNAKVWKSPTASVGFECKSSSWLHPALPSLRWLNHCCFDVPCVSLDHRSLNIKHSVEGQWISLVLSSLLPSSPLVPFSLPLALPLLFPSLGLPVDWLWLCTKTGQLTNLCSIKDAAIETYPLQMFSYLRLSQ